MNRTLKRSLPLLLSLAVSGILVSSALLFPLPQAEAQTTRSGPFDISKGLVSKESLGCDGFDCQLCHVITAVDNVISFMFYLATVVAVLLFIYAGAKMMMAGGDSGAMTKAKEIFWNVIIGVIIMLCAYLVVDTVLKTVLSPEAQRYGPWNRIVCVTLRTGPTGPPNTSSGGSSTCPTGTTGTPPNCTRPTDTCPAGTTGTPPDNCVATSARAAKHEENKNILKANDINVLSSGNCSNPLNSRCTSLGLTTPDTINGVIAVKTAVVDEKGPGYSLDVSGGDEIGHRNPAQQNGTSVDLSFRDPALRTNAEAINRVEAEAASRGYCAVWEVPSGSSCPAGTRRCIVVGHATGAHFSFYLNPSASPSCR